MTYRCLFEQSGTFKNEFKKLGYDAYDYDIQDEFGETDYVIDLFDEINKAYAGGESIFSSFAEDDYLIAFFPCIRFENQIYLHFQGKAVQMKKWSEEKKLENNLKLHTELHDMYCLITKLAIVCLRKGLKLIIENPYSTYHYLQRYWCIQPKLIDMDRTESGDYYTKPTQYWFFNCEPSYNLLFEPIEQVEKNYIHKTKSIEGKDAKISRSMISKQYANRFIREFIL